MNFHKYLLILAALLTTGSAQAESFNVSIYGMLNADIGYVHPGLGKGVAANVGRFRVGSNATNIGFKGEEVLSDTLKAFWQIESAVFLTTGLNQNHLGFASRNTGIGLKHDYGSILVGKWDTPFKILHNYMEPTYAVGPGYLVAILDTAGQNSISIDASSSGASSSSTTAVADSLSFSRRQGNSIQYWSPAWKGISLKVAYSTNVDRNATKNPYLFSSSALYDQDGLQLGVAFEKHNDFMAGSVTTLPYAGTSNKTRDQAWKLFAGYKLPFGTKVGAAASELTYQSFDTQGLKNEYKRIAYIASLQHPIGSYTLRGGFGKAADGKCSAAGGATCSTSKMGAQMAVVAVSQTLSPRTDLYIQGAKIWNGSGAYNFANTPIAATVTNGSDPLATGLGIRHTF